MPKIIENIGERLLEESRKQVMENGYSSMTIRSVAKACGVGVGTVYNYFSSKDMLVASFMLEDWQKCMERIYICCNFGTGGQDKEASNIYRPGVDIQAKGRQNGVAPDVALRCVYHVLSEFIAKYTALFQDESAVAVFASAFPERHKQLRSQLAEPLKALHSSRTRVEPEFLAEFIAENMLTWTMEGRTCEEIICILLPLF